MNKKLLEVLDPEKYSNTKTEMETKKYVSTYV